MLASCFADIVYSRLGGEGRLGAQFRGFQEDPGDTSEIASLSPILGEVMIGYDKWQLVTVNLKNQRFSRAF
jgi:hypothetical protein